MMKKIYIIAAAALALAACDRNEDNPVPAAEAVGISATIGESTATRAADTEWTAGDKIGITLSKENGGRPHVNMEYATSGGSAANGSTKFTGNPIYFYKPMTLTAYYPFAGREGTAPGIITASTNADNQTADNQPKIDFLWASQTDYVVIDNKPEINFSFAHKMSKLTFIFEDGDGVNVSKIVSYTIDGLVMQGTFDPETGACSVKADVPEESLSIDLSSTSVTSGESVAPLILFPQAPSNGNLRLHIYADEIENPGPLQHYSCMLSFEGGKLAAGNNYVFTIKVSKAHLQSNGTITEWTEQSGRFKAESSD